MIKRNENTAELVGLSLGDGGLTYRTGTKSLRFQLRGSLEDDKEHYDKYIIPLFNKEVMFPIFERKVGIVFNKSKGFYGISVQSEKLRELNEVLGIPIGIKRELFIPEWIKNNRNFVLKFLRGFLDTDGSISCQRNYSIKNNELHTQIRLYLSCCSKNLMEEIYDLLKSLEFKCTLRKGKKQKNEWSSPYTIKISGGVQVNKWFEIVGSKNPKHVTKYQIWKKFGFCPPYTQLNERMQILKKEIVPHYFMRECRSGQTG
jgi:intein/homing endonuclease